MINQLKRMMIFGLLALIIVPSTALAFRSGPPANRTGSTASMGVSCTQCHAAAIGAGSVVILGMPTAYEADTVYDLIVRVSDASQLAAGFQISVEDAIGTHVGTMIVSDAVNTKFSTGDTNYINHTSTGVDNAATNWAGLSNAAEYAVQWQAPSTDVGLITFWGAGNAINNDFSAGGDMVYLSNTTIAFSSAVPAVSEWSVLMIALALLTVGSLLLRRSATTV